MAGVGDDAPEPSVEGRVTSLVEATLVGNGVAAGGEIVVLVQMPFHDAERRMAAHVLLGEHLLTLLDHFEVVQPETRHGDVWLVAVLLEEHPLQNLRTRQPVVGQKGRALGQIEQDAARFRKPAPVVELENGFKIYHSGDTGVFDDMALINTFYAPDLALVAIGGHFTMDPQGAAYAMDKLVKPKQVIPTHYGTFPPLKGTPAELKAALGNSSIKVLDVEPGQAVKF